MVAAVSVLAAFMTPGLFFVGAGAVAAPILIHLFARRRFKRIRWAAMDFLIDAERKNRRRVRLEEWLLLALRCAAVFLIAMMVARPFLTPTGVAAAWAGRARIERVFLLDDSFSMGYESPDGTAFGRAKSAAKRILETVRRESPDDTVTILRTSAPKTPVESGTSLEDSQIDSLLARLEALTPTQRSMDLSDVMEAVADVLQGNGDILNAALYVISDFQRKDWVDREADGQRAPGLTRTLLAPLQAWAAKDRGLRLVLVNVGDREAANRAVSELGLQTGRLVAGSSVTLRAQIANYARRPADRVEVRLSVGNIAQPPKTIGVLPAGGTASVDLEAEFPQAGYDWVRVELPPDALPVDDVRYMAVEVAEAIRVLIVNGEPSPDAFDDEVSFIKTALRPEGEVFSGNEVVVVDEAEFEETNLSGFHVVVLANVYRVSEPAAQALEHFVRQGGGVIFCLGDQVDASLYNALLYRDGEGLFPAALTERLRPPGGTHLLVVDRLHPAMRGLSLEGDPLGMGQVTFLEYFGSVPWAAPVKDAGAAQEAIPGRSPPAPPARPARVVAAFTDADQHPAIIERTWGEGRVLLITTTADKEWHYWPDHPTFLPVMMELVRHAARRSEFGRDRGVGERIELPLDPAIYQPDALVRTPAYPAEREVSVSAQAGSDGRGLALTWEHTESSGLYQFLLRRREGGESMVGVAVNVDPRESDLTGTDEGELRRALTGMPFEYIQGVDGLSGQTGESRAEFWRAILLTAVVVLMTEQTLAWFWGRKR